MSMIRKLFKFFVFLIFSANIFAVDNSCESIYQNCFYGIPKNMIVFYKDINSYGNANTNNINLRDIPLISSKNSLIIKKIKKNDRIQIKKVFLLKSNSNIGLKLINANDLEIVNNYRFGKWYSVIHNGDEGFIFSEFISIEKEQDQSKNFLRYRHINSVDWTENKIDQQKNIELVFVINKNSSFKLKGYAWHYLSGFDEINYVFEKDISAQNKFINKEIKLFLFDKNEIYLESDIQIFTGIYKKY